MMGTGWYETDVLCINRDIGLLHVITADGKQAGGINIIMDGNGSVVIGTGNY
ncbi:MAG: hypothetical protein H7320_12350 [Ferruginibacter sp.]|nr:hypothetical protein [Ferruginibacter sp.]